MSFHRLIRSLFTVFVLSLAASPLARGSKEYRSLDLRFGEDEVTLRFALVLPDDFDPARRYPTLLAIPPGASQEQMVERGMAFWRDRAEEEGWIVVSPVMINEIRWQDGGAIAIPPLLDWMRQNFNIEGDRFHLAGVSMGGEAAYAIAIEYPTHFHSLTTMPGLPPDSQISRLMRLKGIPVMTFVGARDDEMLAGVRAWTQRLQEAGLEARLKVMPDEEHVLKSLEGGEALFKYLNRTRRGVTPVTDVVGEVSAVLTDFHDAAANADADRYFGHFAPNAVFFGTDPSERWSVGDLKEYALPYFEGDSAWIYTCSKRNIHTVPERNVAWFDERLQNEKYGHCRGTGVVRKIGDRWRITQYNLSIPIPNDLAAGVVDLIRQTDTIGVNP